MPKRIPSTRRPYNRSPSTPTTRAAAGRAKVESVRRKYKKDTARHVKLLPQEVPHVEDMVVILKLANYSRIDISRIIGISRDQVAEMLAKPAVLEKLVMLRQAIPGAAIELLQDFMIEAVMVLVDVMRNNNSGSKERIQAAEAVLDRGGMPKLSRQEKHVVDEKKTTITDDGIVELLRGVSPEVQERAAQLIEELEVILKDESGTVDEQG